MQEKTKLSSGADELTPSLPQYFSWINNTNEGSTEKQTLINLDYFKWLHDYYGLKLKIYALDAGNLDGASGTYEKLEGEKLQKQFPNGYAKIAQKAREFGCSIGIWAGADGFGNTPEEESERYNLMVSLCKDHGFMLFKFDTVCGNLRAEKRGIFKKMIDECRKYSPELIVLNHRNDFGEIEICATTFLWEGKECYIDIHMGNTQTAMHHRLGAMDRGLVPEMRRLTEDHGVCVSSCLDFFEDDLILQAFNRSLILAPELYGNPWFLRDDEQAKLARLYNLHAKYSDILVNGIELPKSYGNFAVSRGNDKIRFISLRNLTWKNQEITINLDETIGISKTANNKLKVVKYHPTEAFIGTFDYGKTVGITIPANRALLLAVFEENAFNENTFALTNCEYEIVREINGEPVEINILKTNGKSINKVDGEIIIENPDIIDKTHSSPIFLGKMNSCPVPENAEQLYEATMFKVNNDALESQAIRRSGETKIPQVKAARDAFFGQETYKFRGCEAKNIFDNDPQTFFDANTRSYEVRLNGGCLRADFGEIYEIGKIEIEYFKIKSPIQEIPEQLLPNYGEISADLKSWIKTPLSENISINKCQMPFVKFSLHTIEYTNGTREKAVYSPKNAEKIQYFRLNEPMDRIYSLKIFDKNNHEIKLNQTKVHANNMMAPYQTKQIKSSHELKIKLPGTAEIEQGDYIAIAINGNHGSENAYCAAKEGDNPIGFTDRAVSYPFNNWEHIACQSDKNYTYYLQLTKNDAEKEFTFYTLFTKETPFDGYCEIYFCKNNGEKKGIIEQLTDKN